MGIANRIAVFLQAAALVVIAAALFVSAAATFAQESGAAAASPADLAFDPLAKDVQRLHQSLLNKGGISKDDYDIIRAMRDRAVAFSTKFPNDVRGPKLELALSKWLGDHDMVSDLFARILALEPDNAAIRRSWAQLLRSENRYDEAIEVFRNHPPDPVAAPDDAVLLVDCMFAEHQFDEALALIESIPDSALGEARKADLEERKKTIREIVSAWGQEQLIRQKEEVADDLPRVLLVTSRGPITLELFENEAPNTVANFIHLAGKDFYVGTKFHRVIPNFMAQGGDPNTKPGGTGNPGEGDPGYFIADETDRTDYRRHFSGSLSMAKREPPNTGGCQFFITVTPTPHLDGKHTVFGRVIEGLDIARALKQDDVIELVTVTRKRDHEYLPTMIPKVTTTTEIVPVPVDPPPVVTPPVADSEPADDPATDPAPQPDETPDSQPDETPVSPESDS